MGTPVDQDGEVSKALRLRHKAEVWVNDIREEEESYDLQISMEQKFPPPDYLVLHSGTSDPLCFVFD